MLTYQPLTRNLKALSLEKHSNLEIHRMNWLGRGLFNRLESSFILEFLYLTPALLVHSVFFFLRTRNKIDVIHSHGLNAAFIGVILSKTFGKRCIVSTHAIYNLSNKPTLSRLARVVLNRCDVVLAMAERSRLELIRAGIDAHKVKIYTHWVNQHNFRPMDKAKCKATIGLENQFVLLFVGRLLEIKGVGALLEAARELSNELGLTFLFAGDGPFRDAVRKAAANSRNVVYAGFVADKDLPLYYNAADVVIVPSLYEEGYARVILEALSCGTPVVASNRGCITEELDSSVGILVDPTPTNLVDVILQLWKNAGTLGMMRQNCRPYAERRFGEINARMITSFY